MILLFVNSQSIERERRNLRLRVLMPQSDVELTERGVRALDLILLLFNKYLKDEEVVFIERLVSEGVIVQHGGVENWFLRERVSPGILVGANLVDSGRGQSR